jgi:hypothetical protein
MGLPKPERRVYIAAMNTVRHTPSFFALVRLATRLLLPCTGTR